MLTIEEIVRMYGPSIYRYSLKLCCHPQIAQDLAQDTFVQAWKNLKQLQSEQALNSWLRKICYRTFLMQVRKEKQGPLLYIEDVSELEQEGRMFVSEFPMPEESIVIEESIREVQNGCFYAMVRKLSLQQRLAFSMVDMFGLSITDTSELMELSEGAVKGLLYRARRNLDAFFEGHCNLLDSKNPCSCKAWLDFSKNHQKHQKDARMIIDSLEENGKDYIFNEKTRNKIHYIYQNMPEVKPEESWFDSVLEALKNQ